MFSLFKKFFGKYDFEPLIKSINFQEPELEKLTDEELKGKGLDLKKTVQNGKSLDDALVEAFALIREAAKRTLNQRHFDVQLIGGIILHQGKIAEMLTGEGKTLAATAPVYLNALSGRGVHVITVNDYLARRDAVWMGQIYYALGLSIGCLTHEGAYLYDPEFTTQQIANSKAQSVDDKDKKRDVLGAFKVFQEFLRPISRKEAYLADITYGTNHEFGFDYLRDNLSYDLTQQVQVTRLHYAIIDEVDSILIDEARTPLIIAVPDTESSDYYRIFTRVVSQLSENEDYLVDEKMKTVSITDEGIDKVEKILKLKDLYGPENLRLVHYLEECLKAKTLFHRDKQYLIKNGEIIIVDEFTGRLMYGRRYSGGLHQAIEAKENVQVQQESRTFAQITIQNYFRLYKKIAGMTGTAQTSAEEFHKVYNLEVVSVPPNKPMIRKDNSDMIYKTLEAKCRAVIKEVKERHLEGQPILLGTTSITNNEIISDLLKQAGIPHEVLNAKNHEREGLIISQAGKLGAVTVATNMAGRGVDIVLAGNPPVPEEAQKIKELGGLYVIGTERHEARRIDNQLRGRSGRQGDPGTSRFFLSLEDDLLRIFGGKKIKSLMESFNLPEDQPIESKLVSKVVNEAQKKVEGFNFDSRKHLLEYDDILNKQRTTIYRKRQELLEKKSLPQILGMLDILWMNHLENMEALRESVGMRAYGQHDPLVEYRRESHIMFKDMMNGFDKWLEENKEKIEEAQKNMAATQNNTQTSKPQPSPEVLKKIGRNDPCWCGSKDSKTGKPIKYKRCHGV
ncbi:preprotein translocase subunit SecA [Candidatus Wolfebacteria bacterium CG18_big_fil_WC_8_21_14_2_50_39_7]|uniref:Protein translocase subunit SecA n=1 Tax=Candidatus Wolfebacteria bacterium CG18_big_fil_WC_8_21_14_2_50_39_7 TaxID=1975071 RepID=A0A2H0ECF6_9BACT|nr:preprotein translocase subunit SecA [Candidatus Wolfebacteria bacterium]NCP58241.1 preprotein translocase subunit SecA [Candidatus Wolfebacteria bacterium]NCQ02639.1 preprotein translocase subunit SecA [Candidatus Wolfebacteria bacterium]PIP92116.1 MAG: preprotein translocase subunit SecA [Candidatus Wolfebacteria bacterium CG18_big_fil_WC_8_21_14_2_50_39_7]